MTTANKIAADLWAARRAALASAPSREARVAIASESLADKIVAAWRAAKAIPAKTTKSAALSAAFDALDAFDAAE